MVADSLIRHNLLNGVGLTEYEAHELSLIERDKWIDAQSQYLQALQVDYVVKRWDDYLAHAEYKKWRGQVDVLYETSRSCRLAFEKSILEFIKRRSQKINMTDEYIASMALNSLEYLKEECAIIMPMWSSMGVDCVIYPSEMLDAMCFVKDVLLSKENPRWLSVRMEKKYKLFDASANLFRQKVDDQVALA